MNDRLILLIEDNPNDTILMKRAFQSAGVTNPIHVISDGKQALEYLQGAGKYADRNQFPLPDLVLLDLKLPLVMGTEVLKWIRLQPDLKRLIVVVLTSSNQDSDLETCYEFGANSYLIKPSALEELIDYARSIGDYWLKKNQTPRKRQS